MLREIITWLKNQIWLISMRRHLLFATEIRFWFISLRWNLSINAHDHVIRFWSLISTENIVNCCNSFWFSSVFGPLLMTFHNTRCPCWSFTPHRWSSYTQTCHESAFDWKCARSTLWKNSTCPINNAANFIFLSSFGIISGIIIRSILEVISIKLITESKFASFRYQEIAEVLELNSYLFSIFMFTSKFNNTCKNVS